MAGHAHKMICHCKQVDYITIRKAMIQGARTIDEIKEMTGAGTTCGGCLPKIQAILDSVCGCKQVMLADVVAAVEGGATTVEEVGEKTGAGTACGRCKALVQNVIDLGR
ncbi:(2Fe-2S)-binding protein [Turicibacter sanguinis]|uniref:(2Fe-2S)-binding protein n=1 Tax=Turicibacter sanguinis TaxID=154288 RepID=UPI0021D48742|nr:(2Fe-2S)-binding protein [Turicibacter sanguinis]MCU7191964.1 (2Fe-2S)-binding protein [Turicibacter sanguinis]